MKTVILPKNDFLLGLEYFFKKYGYNEVYGSWSFNGDKWWFCNFAVNRPYSLDAHNEISRYLNQRIERNHNSVPYFSSFYFSKDKLIEPVLVYNDGNFFMREDLVVEKFELEHEDSELLSGLKVILDKYDYTVAYGEIEFIQGVVYLDCVCLPYAFNEQAMAEIIEHLSKVNKFLGEAPMCLIGDYVGRRDNEPLYEDGKFFVYKQRGKLDEILE